MDRREIIERLVAGGVDAAALSGEAAVPDGLQRYNGLRDPRGSAALAAALAAELHVAADGILIGAAVEDAVLAAFLGRELGLPVIRSYIDEGLLLAPQLHAGTRLIVLTDVFRTIAALRALCTLAREQGGYALAAASLYDLAAVGATDPDVPHVTLLQVGSPASP